MDAPRGLFGLSGRTALVTGASRGIGATIAGALDSAGARVILCGRDAVALHETSGQLDNDPVYFRADLSSPAGVMEALGAVDRLAGQVDILVNNAGTNVSAPAEHLSPDAWDDVCGLNLRAAFLLARALAPGMARSGWGKIVNIASVLGLVGDVHAAAYIASKAGLIGLTRALAAEWAPMGVGVNALCPGWIDTAMVAGLHADTAFERRVVRRTPVGRWGSTEDIVGPLLLLSSPASDFVVGQTLIVDGGLTATW